MIDPKGIYIYEDLREGHAGEITAKKMAVRVRRFNTAVGFVAAVSAYGEAHPLRALVLLQSIKAFNRWLDRRDH